MTDDISNQPTESQRSWPRRVVIAFVATWTVLVAASLWWLLYRHTGPSVLIIRQPGPSPVIGQETFHAWFTTDVGFQRFFPWVLFGPYVALIALYFPLERGRLRLNGPLNLIACALFLVACHFVNAHSRLAFGNVTIAQNALPPDAARTYVIQNSPGAGNTNLTVRLRQDFKPLPPPHLPAISFWSALIDLLAYGAIVGLAHSIHFYRRFRERENRALSLESSLANARLNALRAQLQPHFFFNSLNAIAALLRRDPRQAETTLVSLSELLRLALSLSEKPEITLAEEIEFVRRYVEIQQTRFGDKLRFEQDIEAEVLSCLVPTLVLQPLVENAIRHGIEPLVNVGLVRLTARRSGGKLILTVEDDGVGLVGNKSNGGTGIGLPNLRGRLETLYGSSQELRVSPRTEGGVAARVEIPWHSAADIEPATTSK